MLLNTSLNNNAEPIVDSVEDAISCFLTTGLDFLVVENYLIKRKNISWQDYLSLNISLPRHVLFNHSKGVCHEGRQKDSFYLSVNYDSKIRHAISEEVFEVLEFAKTNRTVKEVLNEIHRGGEEEATERIVNNLIELWSERLIILSPSAK